MRVGAEGRVGRRRSITAPASPTCTARGRAPARALRINVLGTHHLLDAAARARPRRAAILVTGSALVYRPVARPADEGRSDRIRRARTASASSRRRWSAAPSPLPVLAGPAVQPRGPAAGRALRDVGLRAADRRDRSRTARARPAASATSTRGATSPTCATRCGPIARWSRAAHRAGPTTCARVARYRIGDLLDILLALSRVRVRVETDPARLRPSDKPVIVGDPTRVAADTGWRAEIPIEQTLADLLDYWRSALARADPRPA